MLFVMPLQKAGPFIGPRGGKWADAKHTIPWRESIGRKGPRTGVIQLGEEHTRKIVDQLLEKQKANKVGVIPGDLHYAKTMRYLKDPTGRTMTVRFEIIPTQVEDPRGISGVATHTLALETGEIEEVWIELHVQQKRGWDKDDLGKLMRDVTSHEVTHALDPEVRSAGERRGRAYLAGARDAAKKEKKPFEEYINSKKEVTASMQQIFRDITAKAVVQELLDAQANQNKDPDYPSPQRPLGLLKFTSPRWALVGEHYNEKNRRRILKMVSQVRDAILSGEIKGIEKALIRYVDEELVKTFTSRGPVLVSMLAGDLEKAGPFVGPRGGMWADQKHTIHWDPKKHKVTKPTLGQADVVPGAKFDETVVQLAKLPIGRIKQLKAQVDERKQKIKAAGEATPVGLMRWGRIADKALTTAEAEREKLTEKPPEEITVTKPRRPKAAPKKKARKKKAAEPKGHPKDGKDKYPSTGVIARGMDLTEAEAAIAGQPKEHCVVFGPEGQQLYRGRGGKHSVRVPAGTITASLRASRDGDVIFTHNHPEGGPLSDADVCLAMTMNVKEMRAVDDLGSVYVLRRPDHPDKPEGMWPERATRDLRGLQKSLRAAWRRARQDTIIQMTRWMREKHGGARMGEWDKIGGKDVADAKWKELLDVAHLQRYNQEGKIYGFKIEYQAAPQAEVTPAGVPEPGRGAGPGAAGGKKAAGQLGLFRSDARSSHRVDPRYVLPLGRA